MGGNTFKDLERVPREVLPELFEEVSNRLNVPGLTTKYLNKAMLGSTGKKPTSGDVDLCMNNRFPRFYGQQTYPVFNHRKLVKKLKLVLGEDCVRVGNSDQVFTRWGNYQVDFLFGDFEWMKFSQYSPSPEESDYKGLFLVNSFGVLSKMKRDVVYVNDEGMRVADVSFKFNLEHGFGRTWRLDSRARKFNRVDKAAPSKEDQLKKTDPDTFETRVPCDRYERFWSRNPRDFLNMFFDGVQFEEVNTFEKVVDFVRKKDYYEEFRERLLDQHHRHAEMKRTVTYEKLEKALA